MVTIALNAHEAKAVILEKITADNLFDELGEFYTKQLSGNNDSANGGGLGFQRVAYLVRSDTRAKMVKITLIKPDEKRYWLRSVAMRDADQISTLLMRAAVGSR